MRAVTQGGFRPHADIAVACRVARKALLDAVRKATTRRPDPFLRFLDTFDKFVGAELDPIKGDRC